ncbi:glycosyltransferase [SAR116 cluster alpha proteobacterium HIMB100]|nr:glycosyltransferase [SAR116 cluster alpha proteobacterium HIMB100]
MNITIISKYAPVPGYGSNPRWFELGKRFIRHGHNVEIITSDSNHGSNFKVNEGHEASFKIDQVSFTVLKTMQYTKTASLRRVLSWFDFDLRLFRFKRQIRPDIIVISSLSLTTIIFGLYLKFFKRTKLVFEVRDIWPLTMVEEGAYSRLHPLYLLLRFLELWGYRKADLIVGTMPNLKQHVSNSGVERPDSVFHTCGIGVDKDGVQPVGEFIFTTEIEEKIKNKIIVGYCGSIGLTNNLTDLFTFANNTTEKDLIFLIAGDGAERKKFEAQATNNQNILFLGKLNPEDVQGFLRRCDILFLSTMPSKVWNYGQSMNKVVDYMLAGRFILAQYKGFPSMINEANCGLFTDIKTLEQAFLEIICLPEAERQQRGSAGRQWILQNQNYDDLANRYITKLEDICVLKSPSIKNNRKNNPISQNLE